MPSAGQGAQAAEPPEHNDDILGSTEQAAPAAPRETPVFGQRTAAANPARGEGQPPLAVPAVHAGGVPTPEYGSPPLAELSGARATIDLQSTIELTVRARGGDQLALETLCLRCLKSLTRYAAGRLPPAARGMVDTQDIVLEAVQRGMHRLHEFEVRHPGALIAYMRTILRHLIVDHVRVAVRRPHQVSLDEHHPDHGQSPLERVLDEEQIELYEAALDHLKPRDVALVTLKIEEQLGYDDIAVELGFPSANSARVAARRAVLRLAHEMSRLSRATRRDDTNGPDGGQAKGRP
jgi:RNA polymerase sigma factor (sigma-70 family)